MACIRTSSTGGTLVLCATYLPTCYPGVVTMHDELVCYRMCYYYDDDDDLVSKGIQSSWEEILVVSVLHVLATRFWGQGAACGKAEFSEATFLLAWYGRRTACVIAASCRTGLCTWLVLSQSGYAWMIGSNCRWLPNQRHANG